MMKIAIIGSGISGLSMAYLLQPQHHITLYEKNNYIGGHSRTVKINIDNQKIPVDTGFIVFNHHNYPCLTGLLKHLDVATEKSDMSFGVSINRGWLEYGTRTPLGIFAQKTNLLRPKFWNMLADIIKFNRQAKKYLHSDVSLRDCLHDLGLSDWFCRYYLLAMGASIWSTPTQAMLEFPAQSFIRFFDNHGLLTINQQPQWYTVKGGSIEYIKALTAPLHENIRLNTSVHKVIRHSDCVSVIDHQQKKEIYDHVIFACHSDQVLKILDNPTKKEQVVMNAIQYQPNEMVLHTDINFMPKRKQSWSSWVYLSESQKNDSSSVSLSYWMNNLQPSINSKEAIIVTLNPAISPNEDLVHDRYIFHHPVFDTQAIAAQNKIDDIQNKKHISYIGAWQRYGFHEDGLLSAVTLAKKMGIPIPWQCA